jgi:hypothetical protein
MYFWESNSQLYRLLTMRSSIFLFIGIMESGSDGDINILKDKLQKALEEQPQPIQFKLEGELLTLTLTNPDFRFYLSFAKNERQNLEEYKQLAKDAELPWDIKPVNKARLQTIYALMEEKGWMEYKPYYNIGYHIIEQIQAFQRLKVFTIPSMEKRSFWSRIWS